MNTKQIFMSLTLAVFTTACIKKAKIDLPESENKLVVTCFISPQDSVITALISLSVPKFGTDQASLIRANPTGAGDVQDATVILSDGAKEVALAFDKEKYFYKVSAKQFPIQEGKTYYLNVSTPDGKKVNASTTLPNGKLQLEISELMTGINTQGDREYNFNISVNDLPGQVNYVIVSSQFESSVYHRFPFPRVDTVVEVKSKYDIMDTDEKSAKSNYAGKTTFFSKIINTDSLVSGLVKFGTLNCNRDFYLYNKSVIDAVERGLDNPFGDPVFVYSNITNGLGCFGGYVGVFDRRKIK